MTRNIYALLVGIDQYPSPIPTLQGCVNDITAIEAYLANRINREKYQLHIKKLLDQDATRQAIIDGFETHLCQAESDDIVLFYYSGHGSQETASSEFWDLERDGKLETLVCYDSRTSARDLASKELRCLIAKVAERHPHIVVVLDCCHAGSGTREIDRKQRVRHTAADDRPRKLEEFLPAVAFHLQKYGNGADLPEGQHVLLAGCADREVASEYAGDGKARGAFSYFLLDALNKASSALSYRELFKEVSSRVRSRIKDQTPRLEANHPDDLDNLPFLGGSEIFKPREPFFTLRHDGSTWTIDGGAIHGLPKKSSIPIKLALYPQSSTSEQMRQLSGHVGEAEVIEVLPDKSIVTFTETPSDLTQDTVLKAITVTLPLPTVGVYLEGDLKALTQIRQQLQTVGYGGKPSLYIREVKETTEAQYQLLARDGQYIITKPLSDRPLVAPLQGYDKAFRAVKNLEHIARWTTTIDLANPESQLPANAIKVQIYRDGKEVKDPHLRLEYEYKNNEWQAPTFQVQLTNTHNQPLFCAILDIAEDYSVSVPPFFPQGETAQTGCVRLEPGQEVWAAIYQGNRKISDKISAFFPNKYLEQDITEYQDVFKLIVSTVEFDANLLCQTDLESPQVESGSTTRSLPSQLNSLNLLMAQIQSRQFGAPELSSIDDWVTSQISITTVRPKNLVKLSSQVPTDLSPGVTIQPHSGLRASARLAAVPLSTRNVNGATLPPILDDYTQPFQFTASRGVAPGLSVLELQVDEGKTIEKVTPEDPLFLSVNQPLNEHEYILPIAQDGDFWLPLGRGSRKDGRTEIRIDRLPVLGEQSSGEKTRSLGGAIRIYFQKVVYHNLGYESPYPKLRVAHIAEDGTVCYIEDGQQIKASVAKARRIVLYIHGIIGETESMIPSVQHAKVKVNGQLKSLDQIYDLVLTFDYESLNTPIKELGKQLKDKLVSIGLPPNHGKKLHIVAHSMGGLVCRSMIEQWGGDRIVQHLIMLGTPNAGSPWAAVQDMATFALAAGLNGLSSVVFPAKVLGHLVALIENIDVNLDEMHPTKSPFLQELKDCADPQCPYSIIAGNTLLISQQAAKLNRLQAALQRSWQRAIDLPFMQEAHDIAVTVKSIVGVPVGRSPAAYIQDQVACDHLSYFRHPAGLEALAKAVVRAFSDPFNSTTSSQPPQPPTPQSGSSPGNPSTGQPASRSLQNLAGNSKTQANLQSTVKTAVQATLQHQTNTPSNGKANDSSQAIKLLVEPNSDPSKPETGFANSYAVVIGINDYQSGVPKLRTAVNDAKAIAEILKREHGYTLIAPSAQADQEQNEAWLDQDATLENLSILFEDLGKRIGEGDRLLFYFAGHGIAISNDEGPQGYLIPQDAQQGHLTTYLPMSRLRQALTKLSCRHCLIILDCCYSGSFKWSNTRQLGHVREIYRDNFDLFISDKAWQVITSAAHDQTAADIMVLEDNRDFEGETNSPFAQAFIEALSGEADTMPPAKDDKPAGDGIITAIELCEFVRDKIELPTAKRGKRQTPELWRVDEKHDKGVYIFFTKHFRGKDSLGEAPKVDERNNPYRGLESYEEKDSELFFGKTKVIEDLCDCVCVRPLTVVLGASGSGKSSLAKAGLLPHLRRSLEEAQRSQVLLSTQNHQTHHHKHQQWKILTPIRPSGSPVAELENVLQQVNFDDIPPGAKLLLIIDQFEEVVTQCNNQTEREAFLQRLSKLLENYTKSDTLRIVLTLRLDFEPQIRANVEAELKKHQDLTLLLNAQKPKQSKDSGSKQQLEERIWNAARFIVKPMTREELQEAIEAPAAIKAIQFDQGKRDNRILVQQLIHEVADMPGALPLLSFTLRELYRKLAQRFIDARLNSGAPLDRIITWADYDDLGGVARSLTRRATEEYEKLAKDDQGNPLDKSEAQVRQRVLRWVMLRMVALDGGEIARRRVMNSELKYPDQQDDKRCKAIINRFSSPDVRLLVQGTNLEGKDYVEPAHDALVREWDKIKAWLEGEKEQACAAIKKVNSNLQPQVRQEFLWNWFGIGDVFQRNKKTKQKSEKFNLELQRDLMDAASRWQDVRATQQPKQTLQIDKRESKQENEEIEEKQNTQTLRRCLPKFNVISKSKKVYTSLFSEMSNWLWWNDPRLPLAKEIFESSDNWLNTLETEFLQESITTRETRRKFQLYLRRAVTAVILIAAIVTWSNQERAKIEQIRALRQSSEANLRSNQNFDALMASLQAGNVLKESWLLPLLDNQLKNELTGTLQKTIYAVRERIRLSHSERAGRVRIRFSPNGQLLATAGDDGTIALWNLQGEKLPLEGLEECQGKEGDPIWSIDFSPDNQMVAFGGGEGSVHFCTLQGQKIDSWNPEVGWIISIKFSPDGQLIAAAGTGGAVIWNLQNNSLIRLVEANEVYSISFSPDSQFVATGACDGTASIWNLQGQKLREFQNPGRCIKSINFSPDSQFVAFTGDWDLTHLWKWQEGSDSYKLPNLQGLWGGWSLGFDPSDSQSLAVARNDGSIYLLNLQGDIQETIRSADSLHDVSFSPDGKLLAAAGDNGNISLWSLHSNQQFVQLNINQDEVNQDKVRSISFNSDSQTVATVTDNGTVRWWNLQGNPVEVNKEVSLINDNCDLKERGMRARISDNKAFVDDLQGNLLAETSEGHTNGLTSISCTSDGNLLATVGIDYKVRLWNLSRLRSQQQTPQSLQPIEQWTGDDDVIDFVQFSPDGNQLATGGSARGRGRVRLWNLQGIALATWETNQGSIRDISFSPDGKFLATVGDVGQPTLLPIKSFDELIERGCYWVWDYLATLDDNNADRHLCDGINPPEINQPEEQGNISNGDKILVSSLVNPEKQAGVEAIATADFPSAVAYLDTYLQTNLNDPEARIYLNNARIADQKSYTIAVSVPIGSDVTSDANGALEVLRGVAQAQELHNKQIRETGSNEPLLKVLIADDRNDPEVAKVIAQQLANNPSVFGVVGHFSSNVTRAAAEIYNKEELLAISPVSTSVDLSDVLGRYVFRTVPSDAVAAESLANYMIRSNKTRAAVFYNSRSEYSTSLKNAFQSTIEAQKGQVIEFIDFSDPNFAAEQAFERSMQNSAEVLVLLPNTEVLDKALEVVKVNDRRIPLLAGDDVYGTMILDQGGEQACGLIATVPWHILAHGQTDFSSISSTLWQADVNWRSAMAYDATQALIASIQQAPGGEATRRSMVQALQNPDFTANGASDAVQFSRGDRAQNNIQLVEIQPGVRSGYGYDFVPVPIDSFHTSNCTRF